MWSGTKRKVEALVGYVLPAVVDRAISKAVEWYEARTSVDDELQLQRLRMLSIKLHSAVEAADGVHIRSWWLRRWLWTLRDAALEADEVLRLFRERRAAGETDAASHRSAKSLIFWRDDSGSRRLSPMVARLEGEAMGIGDFLKMLELQIREEVVGGVVDRSMSAAVARYESRTSVDDQLDRLHRLSIKVHSAVEAAERVHIRSWWLHRWLWRLRDAALDGDEVLQLFRPRRAAEETGVASKQAAGNMVWRALGSVKILLFGRDDGGVEQLSRMVARLEREAMGLGDFLKMLELQIRDDVVPLHVPHTCSQDDGSRYEILPLCMYEAGASVDEQLERQHLLLVMVRHIRLVLGNLAALILRAAGRLIRKPPAPPPPASRAMILDAGAVHDLVARIQRAVHDARHVELRGKRSWLWLDKWRGELQAVASRADRVLLTLPVKATPDGIHFVDDDDVGDEVWRMAQIVEAAAAHLEDFVTLVRLARRQIRARPSTRRGIPRISFVLSIPVVSLFFLLLFSLSVLLGWRYIYASMAASPGNG